MRNDAASRIGIVGLGYIGTTVGDQFHRHPDATVRAICDLDAARRDDVGREFDVPADRRCGADEAMLEEASLDAGRIDRCAHLDVRFENGATGTFAFHGDAPSIREHVHVWDDAGAIHLEGTQWGSRDVLEIDAEAGEYAPYVDARGGPSRADAFLESVRAGTDPPATARDALRVTALTDAAYEAARTGTRVDV